MSQAALAYAIAHPAVTTVIPGAKTPQQVSEIVGTVDRELSQAEMA